MAQKQRHLQISYDPPDNAWLGLPIAQYTKKHGWKVVPNIKGMINMLLQEMGKDGVGFDEIGKGLPDGKPILHIGVTTGGYRVK